MKHDALRKAIRERVAAAGNNTVDAVADDIMKLVRSHEKDSLKLFVDHVTIGITLLENDHMTNGATMLGFSLSKGALRRSLEKCSRDKGGLWA